MRLNGRMPFRCLCCASAWLQEREFVFVQVFGIHVKLPSEFYCDSTDGIETFMFAGNLQSYMRTIRLHPDQSYFRSIYSPKDLTTVPYAILRCDSVKIPLHPAHSGLFRVIFPNEMYSVIDKSGHTDTVGAGSRISWLWLYDWRFFRKIVFFSDW